MADFIHVLPFPERVREPLRALLRGEPYDWPRHLAAAERRALAGAAEEHAIAPMLYAREPLPELRDAAMHAAATEPLRLRDLREVLAALDAAGVFALIVKGSALAYDLYAEPELRPRADVDLLIAAGDRPRAAHALTELGFTAHVGSGDELALRQESFFRTDAFGVTHVYDVHWEIANPAPFAGTLRFDELRPRAVPLPRIAPQAFTIPHAEALLLACVHRVAHHHDSDRLIWLADIHLLREALSEDERRAFWRLAAERRVVAICRRSIALAAEWFGGQVDDEAARFLTPAELAADEPSRAYLDRDQRRGSLLVMSLRALPGWRARGQRLRQLAFPPAEFMFSSFGTRSRAALPFLYAYRGARGLLRLLRRIA